MRASTLFLPTAVALGLAAGAWWWSRPSTDGAGWRTATIERTDVFATVSATGTVEALDTVEIGTQVSGIVAELAVDFNDTVHTGQVLARIDPTLLEADVAAAAARVASARANSQRDQLALERTERLHAGEDASQQELEAARADAAVSAAEVQAAEVALNRARRNLGYTRITAPIDGTVVKRAVELGQTVNAGFSAPTLFVLVGDLRHLRVLANVDEADIGRVKAGQEVKVQVTTWPDLDFPARVERVRLQSELQDNVVTYPVELSVENPEGKLLPGMTTTLSFIVASSPGALCVPHAALRFQLPDPAAKPADAAVPTTGGRTGSPGRAGGGERATGGDTRQRREGREGRVWILTPDGDPQPVAVEVGLRGATCTEVSGEGLGEGTEVVVGVDRANGEGGNSPFATPPASGFRGGGF